MSKLKNDRLLKAIWHQPLDYTPIWIMRQAGRYLPEYRQLREKAGSFMNLCQTPALACEATLQPLRRYALDAAIIFSDILTIPDAMGLALKFVEGEGPQFAKPLNNTHDILTIRPPEGEKLDYVYQAIRLVVNELNNTLPVIGFSGSPWTLAAYMIEGRSAPGFPRIFALLREAPNCLQQLLATLALSVTAHLNAQIAAGASVVMIFDTWGGLLNNEQYETLSLSFIQHIVDGLKRNAKNEKVPCVLYTKGGSRYLSAIANTGVSVIGLDWEIDLQTARHRVGHQVALQGNLNPQILLTDGPNIRKQVAEILSSYGSGSGHIFNLGHGITPDVPPDHVAILVEAVHELSQPYHEVS